MYIRQVQSLPTGDIFYKILDQFQLGRMEGGGYSEAADWADSPFSSIAEERERWPDFAPTGSPPCRRTRRPIREPIERRHCLPLEATVIEDIRHSRPTFRPFFFVRVWRDDS